MRKTVFSKTERGEWECRPFQGIHYRIIKRWLKGYVLYLNGEYLTSEATLNAIKRCAGEHLQSQVLAAVNPYR
jgi:hypothetical protein